MKGAFFFIFLVGPPSSVGGLEINVNGSSISISWTPPFSLDVTGVDPDVNYSVFIYSMTNETVPVTYPDCANIADTLCVFTPDYVRPCHKYMYIFDVTPYNGAGQGESSQNVTGNKSVQ